MTKLSIQSITHAYGEVSVLRDVSFEAKPGELTCLAGPSGCGKTTILRVVAGLERLQSGKVLIGSEDLSTVAARKRRIGFVFQQPSLFPHLTVQENIRFGLFDKVPAERAQISNQLLEMIELEALADRYPHQLSGGQQQRVALARALAPKPRLMLLDEPFANLDQALRADIREEVIGLLKAQHIPMVMVTHDSEEALNAADHLVLLRADGCVHQAGKPREIANSPVDAAASAFFSGKNT